MATITTIEPPFRYRVVAYLDHLTIRPPFGWNRPALVTLSVPTLGGNGNRYLLSNATHWLRPTCRNYQGRSLCGLLLGICLAGCALTCGLFLGLLGLCRLEFRVKFRGSRRNLIRSLPVALLLVTILVPLDKLSGDSPAFLH